MLKIKDSIKKDLATKVATMPVDTKFAVIVIYRDADYNFKNEAFEIVFNSSDYDTLSDDFTVCNNVYNINHFCNKTSHYNATRACSNYNAEKLINFFCDFYLVKFFEIYAKSDFNPVEVYEIIF